MSDIKCELYDSIIALKSLEAGLCFQESLGSVLKRIEFSDFHAREINSIMKSYSGDDFDDGIKLLFRNFKNKKFEQDFMKAEAHAVACIQNLHAISDNISYIVFLAMNIDIPEDQVYLSRIGKKISREKKISTEIDSWNSDADIIYLNDLCNISKHRFIVDSKFGANKKDNKYGLRFSSMVYKKNEYNAEWVEDKLKLIGDKQKIFATNVLTELINEINLDKSSGSNEN